MSRQSINQTYLSILELTNEEANDEQKLKKAYRRASLRWHPDKTRERTESQFILATKAFNFFKRRIICKEEQYDASNDSKPTRCNSTTPSTRPVHMDSNNGDDDDDDGNHSKYREYSSHKRTFDASMYDNNNKNNNKVEDEDIGSRARFDQYAFTSGHIESSEYRRVNAAAQQPLVNARTGRTDNITVCVDLSLKQVYEGCMQSVEYERITTCPKCTLNTHTTCTHCRGTRYCKEWVERTVRIEKSTFEGTRLILQGESHRSYDAEPGNVIVYVGEEWSLQCPSHHIDGYSRSLNWLNDIRCSNPLIYIRQDHDVIISKQVTVEQTVGQFSFCFYSIDRRKVVLVEKRRQKVLMPYTVLCVDGLGFWNRDTRQYGNLLIRFIVMNARYLTTRKRKRWAALMLNDHFSTKRMASVDTEFGSAKSNELFRIKVRVVR